MTAAPGHANLWLYAAIVIGVVALPGMDMGIVIASTIAGSLRAGFAAIAGCVSGGVVHVVMGVLGVSVVLGTVPAAFNVLLVAGALYLAWLGLGLLRYEPGAPSGTRGVASARGAYTRGALTSLLNPKAYLYTLAILPQFVRPEYGPMPVQAATIIAINAFFQFAIYGAAAWLALGGRTLLAARPGPGRWIARATGLLLFAAAAASVLKGWR